MNKTFFTIVFLIISVFAFGQNTSNRVSGGSGGTDDQTAAEVSGTFSINGVMYDNVQAALGAVPDSEILEVAGVPTGTPNRKLAVNTLTGDVYYDNGTIWVLIKNFNVYSQDGTLLANRTLTTGGNTLTFNQGVGSAQGDRVIFSKDVLINGIRAGTGDGSAVSFNTVFGKSSGTSLVADAQTGNTFFGAETGQSQATTSNNSFFGFGAGRNNTTAGFLTFIGYDAGQANTTGQDNTALGYDALQNNDVGQFNTALGYAAGRFMVGGSENVMVGWGAGRGLSLGSPNTASANLFVGYQTGWKFQAGNQNTLIGYLAAEDATNLNNSTTLGFQAGRRLTTGDNSTLIGSFSGQNLTTGLRNTFLGVSAGSNIIDGNNNTILGANISAPTTNTSNWLALGLGNGAVVGQYDGATTKWTFENRFRLAGYTGAITDGPATFGLAVDAEGDIVTVALGGGGGNTLYSADDALAGNRVVTLGTNTLNFNGSTGSSLRLDGTSGNVSVGNAAVPNAAHGLRLDGNIQFWNNEDRIEWRPTGVILAEYNSVNNQVRIGQSSAQTAFLSNNEIGFGSFPVAGEENMQFYGNSIFKNNVLANRGVVIGSLDSPNATNQGINIETSNDGILSTIRDRGNIGCLKLASGLEGDINDTFIHLYGHDHPTRQDEIHLIGANVGVNTEAPTRHMDIDGQLRVRQIPVYATTAAAAADVTLLTGDVFRVSNGDGTSALHIKE